MADAEASAPAVTQAPQLDQEPATAPQMRMMHACFKKVGLGAKDPETRAERLRATSLIIGRSIGSANELSKTEAQTLLDTLNLYGDMNNAQDEFVAMVQDLEDATARAGASRDDATDHAA